MQPLWDKCNTPEVNVRKGSKGSSHPKHKPVGTRTLLKRGYVKIKTEEGWKYEHRVVTNAKPGEHVHHDDEVRSNNDPKNLKKMNLVEHLQLHKRRKRDAIQIQKAG